MNGLLAGVIWIVPSVFGGGIQIIMGLVSGFAVLLNAIMLNSHPREHVTWDMAIMIFSVLTIVIGGGFVIGLVLGLIAGILTLVQET
jgi:hypothetical protein